jgi:xylulose-5-phosphate/fructose-6-phosphate phosphoketolase
MRTAGLLMRELELPLPEFRSYAVDVPQPGAVNGEATQVLGGFLRDVVRLNQDSRNFRIMGPRRNDIESS